MLREDQEILHYYGGDKMAETMDAILPVLRRVCGLGDDDSFDSDLLVYAGGTLSQLAQVGVGREDFILVDETQTWEDLLGPEAIAYSPIVNSTKQFVQLSVRLLFDPPQPSAISHTEKVLDEHLWRLQVHADTLLKKGGVINGIPEPIEPTEP